MRAPAPRTRPRGSSARTTAVVAGAARIPRASATSARLLACGVAVVAALLAACAPTNPSGDVVLPDITDAMPVSTFYAELAPYGRWLEDPVHGWVWTPYEMDPLWRPYTVGRWVWSDEGWVWISDQPWGWATDHYGRWMPDDGYGWVWVPGTEWAPAWVMWRLGEDWVGWAPAPPGTAPPDRATERLPADEAWTCHATACLTNDRGGTPPPSCARRAGRSSSSGVVPNVVRRAVEAPDLAGRRIVYRANRGDPPRPAAAGGARPDARPGGLGQRASRVEEERLERAIAGVRTRLRDFHAREKLDETEDEALLHERQAVERERLDAFERRLRRIIETRMEQGLVPPLHPSEFDEGESARERARRRRED